MRCPLRKLNKLQFLICIINMLNTANLLISMNKCHCDLHGIKIYLNLGIILGVRNSSQAWQGHGLPPLHSLGRRQRVCPP